MMYTKFNEDYVKRTIENINNYSGKYEVTNIINSCVALLLLPRQSNIKNPVGGYDFSNWKIKRVEPDLVIKFLRDTIAHISEENIKFIQDSFGEICQIKFVLNKKGLIQEITVSVEEFKNYIIWFAKKTFNI